MFSVLRGPKFVFNLVISLLLLRIFVLVTPLTDLDTIIFTFHRQQVVGVNIFYLLISLSGHIVMRIRSLSVECIYLV